LQENRDYLSRILYDHENGVFVLCLLSIFAAALLKHSPYLDRPALPMGRFLWQNDFKGI